MAGGAGWSQGRDLRTPVPGRTRGERGKGWRELLGPKTLRPGPPCGPWTKGPQEVAKDSNGLMGKMGLDLSIPVYCPLVTECHSPPLPYGCQGNWANTTPAGSPKPSPHPTKPPDACRKGKASYPLPGKEEVREAGPDRLVSFPLLSPKTALTFPTPAQGGHRELGRLSGGKEAHSSPGLQKERPHHPDGCRCPLPSRAGLCPGPHCHLLSGVEREPGGGLKAELRKAPTPTAVCEPGSLQGACTE